MRETGFNPWVGKISWRREWHLTLVFLPLRPKKGPQRNMGFPGGSDSKASACNAGDLDLIPGSGKSPGEGNGNPLQYSCLENVMDGGAWWVTVHRVAKSRTRLSDFTFNFHFHALEKEMATHSSVLAWRIPWTEEPGGLQSMGSPRVGHD